MSGLLRYLAAESALPEADIVIAGVPFDGTSSFRPGSHFAPNAIRQWSEVLETYSPEMDSDLEELRLADVGDLPVRGTDWDTLSEEVGQAVGGIVGSGKAPLLLGGEHLISLPAVEACLGRYPELAVIHMDAHMDLRDRYDGRLHSHATVMKRVLDLVGPARLRQFGIRSGTREEWALSRRHGTLVRDPGELGKVFSSRPVYLSVDLDVLDPSVMPETGTPEPGGLSFNRLHRALDACRGLHVVAADVVEYCPPAGGGGPSGAVAAKVVRQILFLLAEARGQDPR